MKTHELLELAALDAMGLLDDDEREAFDRAFRSAPPAVQAQVRREQTRIARDESLLPPVAAPLGLRARVLAAVREAMHAATARRHLAGRLIPPLLPSRGVTPVWRAVAIGCAAAALVFGLTTLQMRTLNDQLSGLNHDNVATDAMLHAFGPTFERAAFNHNTQFVQFTPTATDAEDFHGKALLLLDPQKKTGELYCIDLPPNGREFQLVLVDEKGNVVGEAVLTIRSTGSKFHKKIDRLSVTEGLGLALIATGDHGAKPAPLLKSNKI